MIAEKKIQTIEIYHEGKLVASIITEDPVNLQSSNEIFFSLSIGDSEIDIAAEKIIIS